MLHHDARRLLDALDGLNPAQIEYAQSKIRDLRRRTEAISEIEARTNQAGTCPHCGDGTRQKWGAHGPKSSATDAAAAGRPTPAEPAPQSVLKLAGRLGLNKYTIWRWRMLMFSIIVGSSAGSFSGIVEADEC
ncbi:hypothetical protein [Marinovum sp.]|uniref:hypothetical protein n=1 Tax=Marinovum sp. TaxID=2024839 RepID=UPI002B26BEA3|nr:hypothetical protein [Marinovum sp.]